MSGFFEKALKAVENMAPQDNKKHHHTHKIAYHVYSVMPSKQGEKWIRCRIGIAFHNNKEGGGYDIILNALPLGSRLALRKPKTDRRGHTIEDGEGGPGIVSIEEV